MEDWVDEAAESLERITRDPMANAHRGTLRILSVSELATRGRYQACTMRVELEAPGLAAETDTIEVVFHRTHWPAPGRVLPARISRRVPREFEVDWAQLAR